MAQALRHLNRVCVLLRQLPSALLTMSVSAEEVAKHNTDKDCWVIVGDQVLDVTNFLSRSDGEVHVARIVSL